MPWQISRESSNRSLIRPMPSSPRLVPAAPITPDFNCAFGSDPWEDLATEVEPQGKAVEDLDLQAEIDAWEAASDDAFENLEESLPE